MKTLLKSIVRRVRLVGRRPLSGERIARRRGLERQLIGSKLSLQNWLPLTAGRLYVDLPAEAAATLRTEMPEEAAATVAAAKQAIEHRFSLLGSGDYVPRDPDRPKTAGGYEPIDWYLDPVSGLRFPRGIPHRKWELYSMRPGRADVKLPWELARCQHWAPLGQAYRLTGDSRFALEIVHQLDDFVAANPVGIGINWTCTMDVALRAANWAFGLALVRPCTDVPAEFWARAYTALFDHGVFIRGNLENTYEITSNHYLSNLAGLYYLASVFRDLPAGRRWNRFCRAALEKEMVVQVLDDGADFESSLPYHRLVAELFLGAARIADRQGEPFGDGYRERLRRMFEFLVGVLRPDGLTPQVGDADDGRLHIFTGYGDWRPQDARHLLGPAALMFDQPEWLDYAGEAGRWEAAWWGFDVARRRPEPRPLPPITRLFPGAGLAVDRGTDGTYLLITNGVVGTKGFGNHKHNDLLGFEYHFRGAAVFVDPGSFVYTSDFEARNLFRGTASHNTLGIDGVEQNDLRPEWIFRLFETAHPETLSFREAGAYVEYRGRHRGYERLAEPVAHERRFRLLRPSGALLILDRLTGTGEHEVCWHFHCAPGVEVEPLPDGSYRLVAAGGTILLRTPPELRGRVVEAWYSPSYGVRVPCLAIEMADAVAIDGAAEWRFAVEPAESEGRDDPEPHWMEMST